ncbi:ABC transporter ATP-binding protein [Venenivibrio stagnispumantis]|uniref:ABC transporter ATP-binding protein n=1 Tax=Venenivibrio stagnispumantis TaxID=407998 RepID=UPI0024BB6089|nr:ABC transporter ATP-binding protein [Venenivibrio stagnispumantis]
MLSLIGSIIEAGSLAGITFIVKNVVDKVFIEKDLEKLKIIVLLLFLIAVIKQIGFGLKEYMYPLALLKVMKDLREKIFQKLINVEYQSLIGKQYGDILSRATNDLEAFRNAMLLIGIDLITHIFTVLFMVFVLIYRDWKLFLIFLFITPLLALSFNYFGEKRKKYSQKNQESASEYTQFLNQLISGIETIKLFNLDIIKEKFKQINENYFKNQRKNALYDVFYLSSLETVSYIATAGIILYGGYRIIKGEITTGDLFSFLSALLILVNSLQTVQRGAIQLKVITPITERIKYLLHLPTEKEEGLILDKFKEKIEYKNVYLNINNHKILKDINAVIKKGDKIGIVGQTGSGKSSFIKLLIGIYKNYQGEILIDNVELRKYNIKSLRYKIGIVSQDIFIFNDTIKNNLLIANPTATDEQIKEALINAKADFVFNLKDGLNTIIGERGSSLSGGERQRLALARVFLKNPEIIILDEATSALDVQTEDIIVKQIFELFKEKTLIIIAHRLKTINSCDKILVFDKGQIVEEGDINSLLSKKGIFYELYSRKDITSSQA